MLPRADKRLIIPALLAAGAFVLPASASAARAPKPFDAVATISECGADTLTVAAEIKPSTGTAAQRIRVRTLRKVRGANLKLRFEATPLYGESEKTDEVDLGRATSGRRFELFNELPANSYAGVVRYRWVKGSRTVYSGVVRTTKAKAAGRRGSAYCALPIGKAPEDTTPPLVLPIPYDSAWKRGPLTVLFLAFDDLSGVSAVFWRLDGGPFKTGRALKITTEGSHTLQYVARDLAGNQSKLAVVTLRVDLSGPTTPSITTPSGNVSDTTPDISWTPSTDAASGVQFYYVLVRDSGNAIVRAKPVRASDPTTVSFPDPLPAGQYTAEVIAIDGATPTPFTTTATSSFSVVDPATATTSDSDGDGRTDGADNCPFVSNADQADLDADGSGNACDADDDGDQVADTADNCPTVSNASQANDRGGSAAGDACEDQDSDGVVDASDNCTTTANADQANADGDAQGNACDPDDDNDGIADATDNCDFVASNDQTDTDGDGQGNPCDSDDDADGISDAQEQANGTNPLLADTDSDSVGDASDNCPLTGPSDQTDTDGDGQGNVCDADDDGDGVADTAPDNCPLTSNADQLNTDGANDGGNACDDDDDNDGRTDVQEGQAPTSDPLDPDTDDDGSNDGNEIAESTDPRNPDSDGDGIQDGPDNCPTAFDPTNVCI